MSHQPLIGHEKRERTTSPLPYTVKRQRQSPTVGLVVDDVACTTVALCNWGHT